MITWANTIVQKKIFVAIVTSLNEIDFSAQITQRVYTLKTRDGPIERGYQQNEGLSSLWSTCTNISYVKSW